MEELPERTALDIDVFLERTVKRQVNKWRNRMKLFWCPQTRSARAIWMLEESGLDYEPVMIDIRDRTKPRDPDFALASPLGKVPAIADGDVKIWDSSAIALYVADKATDAKLAPAIR